ncbi:MAG: TIGR03792 family protein [Cyanobium sp. CZS 25K]|nr:TIGR03792 family protein [Cyanobium sp. CZS25K]
MTRRPPWRLAGALAACCLLLFGLALLPGNAAADSLQGPVGLEAPGAVVEHVRVKVPAGAQQAWLQAEQEIWEPWLRRQEGFLGRELLWDGEREEGLLLIRWRSRRQWLAIPAAEIDTVQRRFEAAARRALDAGVLATLSATNPFPLVYAGELEWLGLTPGADAEDGP